METNREELTRIKEALKRNPKGMNVIEIARAIDMHRQSVTKYVEMLVVSGQVEMKSFGPSKVYYLSQRLPVSAMLSLSSDMILLLDRDLRIINVNNALLTFLNARREDILNKEMSPASFPLEFDPSILPFITDALHGIESKIEALFKKKGQEQFFIVKLIPVVFDDGQPGATVLFENVTEQKAADREKEKLIARLQATQEEMRAQAKALEVQAAALHAKNAELEDQIRVRKRAEEALADARGQVDIYTDLMNNDIANLHQIALGQLELARELLAEKGLLDGEAIEMIDTPVESLLQSTRLIDDVRRLNKLIRFKNLNGPVDLDKLLAEVADENSRDPGNGQVINYIPVAGCQVMANPLLKDVFNSLVGYAINHAGGKARVDIRVGREGHNGSSFYRVTVEDDGRGIPDEEKDEVFHYFISGHPDARSLVRGQYIIRTLVENFNGRIRVEDRVPGDHSQGSRYVVDLPVAEGEHDE